jgi:glycosyltransferase involved in cell wall biosynthesis
MTSRPRFFVDLTPVCRSFRSGIGFALTETLRAIDEHKPFHDAYDVVGFAPFDIVQRAQTLGLQRVRLQAIPVPFKVMQALYRLRLMPPVDVWLGRGTYLFYDFRRLPLTKKSKSIVCIHDLTYKKYPQFCEPKNLAFLQRFVPPSAQAADTIIAVSEQTKQDIIHELGVPPDKVTVIYPPADDLFYRRSPEEIKETSAKYALPGIPYFLSLGNSEPRKNLDTVLAAYEKLGQPTDIPPLVLFGGMAWSAKAIYDRIESLTAKGYKVVKPNQYVDDPAVPAIISGALAVVTPSIYEGFGYAPLQAVLCQTPAIVSSGMPVNEVVGDYTTKVPAGDIDQLANALHNIQSTGYHALTVNRQAAMDKVSLAATATRLLSAVNRLEGSGL